MRADPPDKAPGRRDAPLQPPDDEKLRLELQDLRAKLRWDRWIGHGIALVGCVILVLGFVKGMHDYAQTRRLEVERRLWETQLDVYARMTSAATRISVAPRDSAIFEYHALAALYFGEFSLFADTSALRSGEKLLQGASSYVGRRITQTQLLTLSKRTALEFRQTLREYDASLLQPVPDTLP